MQALETAKSNNSNPNRAMKFEKKRAFNIIHFLSDYIILKIYIFEKKSWFEGIPKNQ